MQYASTTPTPSNLESNCLAHTTTSTFATVIVKVAGGHPTDAVPRWYYPPSQEPIERVSTVLRIISLLAMLENEHLFMTVRTSRAYLWFNVLQLALTFGLLLCFFWSSYQMLAIL
jgi:hypothetical protein